MNTSSQIIMSIAYLFFIASVLPNVRAVWKNRHNLKGFSRFGVSVTAFGLILVQTSFLVDHTYLPFIIGFPNMLYWQILLVLVWKPSGIFRQ